MTNKLLVICGPTASGKTALAIECAKLLNSEVISADSLYIYKGLDIGTAKPSISEMKGVKHHLINIVNSDATFSVSDYKMYAKPIIDKLQKEDKIPVICGGTGFYINSILFDLSYGNGQGNLEVREKYSNMAKEFGIMEKSTFTSFIINTNKNVRSFGAEINRISLTAINGLITLNPGNKLLKTNLITDLIDIKNTSHIIISNVKTSQTNILHNLRFAFFLTNKVKKNVIITVTVRLKGTAALT